MFFTPPSITNRLLDDLEAAGVSFESHSFLDPACGGAAFLAPIATRMRLALKKRGLCPRDILESVQKRLFGTDIDQTLCQLSRNFLLMVLADEISAAQYAPKFFLANADSLSGLDALLGQVDVVVCNPPYRKMRSDEVETHRSRFSEVMELQPNLYGVFMAQCLRLLKQNGIAALVTPTSFLSGQSFAKLRTYLMAQSSILQVGIVADRTGIFIDVEQETAITMLRQRPVEHVAETSANVAVVSRNGTVQSVGACMLPNCGGAWPIPRTVGDAEMLRLMGQSRLRLSDYGYRVRIGALVWNRDKRRTFLTQGRAKQAKAKNVWPLLWSSDVSAGTAVSFAPNGKDNGEPTLVEVSGDSRIIIRNPAVVMQRVTSNDQPRRLVAGYVDANFIRQHGGFVGENHVVILESREGCQVSPETLVRILGASAIERYFRCISGAINVSVFELLQLPMPDALLVQAGLASGLDIDCAVVEAFNKP